MRWRCRRRIPSGEVHASEDRHQPDAGATADDGALWIETQSGETPLQEICLHLPRGQGYSGWAYDRALPETGIDAIDSLEDIGDRSLFEAASWRLASPLHLQHPPALAKLGIRQATRLEVLLSSGP